jgi:hypothetical protein
VGGDVPAQAEGAPCEHRRGAITYASGMESEPMYSQRFERPIRVTAHARARMADRGIGEALLLDLIETGELRHKDEVRVWIAKRYAEGDDNLVCAAAVLESALVIKTVMHHFAWEPEP